MPYFESQRKTKKVVLPSDKSLWVEVYANLTWKEEKEVGTAAVTGGVPLDAVLKSMITNWNLEDENGVAPVDVEHIDLLDRSDALAIVSAIEGIMSASTPSTTEKKSLSKKSPQP